MTLATPAPHRIPTIDSLRGIAAFGGLWYHFTENFLPPGIVTRIGSISFGSVDVFFFISGFVIPYALYTARYEIKSYPQFIAKRFVRLDPPYLVSLLLVIVLGYLNAARPNFHGVSFRPSLPQVLLHIGYLNVFFGYPWLNDVYWTLAIELQYYFLVGLLFPLIEEYWIPLFIVLGILAFRFPSETFVFHYMFLLMLGIHTYRYYAGHTTTTVYLLVAAILCLGIYLTLGPYSLGAGVFGALAVSFIKANPFRFLGRISYSVYLLHVPVGSYVLAVGRRVSEGFAGRLTFVFLAMLVSVLAARILYLYVERPAQKWAKGISYKRPSTSS
jgi:peptidoglycan/LPS O-acetylase OafA/YrhL